MGSRYKWGDSDRHLILCASTRAPCRRVRHSRGRTDGRGGLSSSRQRKNRGGNRKPVRHARAAPPQASDSQPGGRLRLVRCLCCAWSSWRACASQLRTLRTLDRRADVVPWRSTFSLVPDSGSTRYGLLSSPPATTHDLARQRNSVKVCTTDHAERNVLGTSGRDKPAPILSGTLTLADLCQQVPVWGPPDIALWLFERAEP